MTIEITSLSDVPQETYDEAFALVTAMVQAAYPSADLRRGAIFDLLLSPAAALSGANQSTVDRARRSNSLQAIEEDPTLADDDVLDRLASNFRVTRLEAQQSTGTIAIVIETQIQTVVPAGTVFSDAAGNSFTADAAYTARVSSGEVVASTDRLLQAVGDGTYVFTMPVTAVTAGSAGNIARLTALTTTVTITYLDRIYAATDFTGGRDEETNTDLFDRIKTGWAVRSLATRGTVDGLIRAQEGFEDAAVSVVGFGDIEQRRSHSILPVSLPGRVDVWVRPARLYQTTSVTVTATLVVAIGGGAGRWEFVLDRDAAPGFYEITRINQANDLDATGYQPYSDSRAYNLSAGATDGLTYLPDITSAEEAAYSRYSTATIRFNDPDTQIGALTVGVSTRSYVAAVKVLPDIDVLQDLVASRSQRSLSGDCLVRAAVPVFVTATVVVKYQTGSTAPEAADIQEAAAAAVNATGFIGQLASAVVANAIDPILADTAWVSTVTLTGTARLPDGTTAALSGTALDATTDPAGLLSSRTCCFFLAPASVAVTLTAVDVPVV